MLRASGSVANNPCVFSLKDDKFRYMTIAVLFLFEDNRWYLRQQSEVNNVASWLGFPYPKEYFEKEEYMSFYGKQYRVPSPHEEFIELMYGDWRTPTKIHFGVIPEKKFYPGDFIDEENKEFLNNRQQTSLNKLRKVVKNRVVGIMSHGESIKELEQRAKEFKDYDICWVSFKHYNIMEDFILKKIDKKLEIVLDCSASKFKDFEIKTRIPTMKEHMKNNTLFLSTWRLLGTQYREMGLYDFYQRNKNNIVLVDDLFKRLDGTPNTLFLLISAIAVGEPKKIILFGVDGKKTESNDIFEGYYKPELQAQYRKVSEGDVPFTLHYTTQAFETRFDKLYPDFCKRCNVKPPEVINCSPDSVYPLFKKITYDELHKELK